MEEPLGGAGFYTALIVISPSSALDLNTRQIMELVVPKRMPAGLGEDAELQELLLMVSVFWDPELLF